MVSSHLRRSIQDVRLTPGCRKPQRGPRIFAAALAVLASIALLPRRSASAADLVNACQEGFVAMAETADAIVCRWEGHADSEAVAERVSRQWARRAACESTMEGPQTSISQVDQQAWLVVVRYACGN
jgi:hypothetical protein